MPRSVTIASLFLLLAGITGPLSGGQSASICRDADGRPVFSDQGCPEDTVQEGRGYLPSAQGYSGEESIDTDVLNNYERRYNTGTEWQWQNVPPR